MLDSTFYDGFHEATAAPTAIPAESEFTYHIILSLIKPYAHAGVNALDIGCANGSLALYMANNGASVDGIDISPKAIQAAANGAKKHGLSDKAHFEVKLLDEVPDTKQYDLVTIIEVLEHLENDGDVLKKIFNVLASGGHLLVTVPSKRSLVHRIKMVFVHKDDFDERVGHLRRYTFKRLEQLVTDAGFEIVRSAPGEGPLRNMLFAVARLERYVGAIERRPWFRKPFEALDTLATKVVGEAQLTVIAKKN